MLSDLKGRGDARFAGILAGSIVIGVALVMVLLPVASVASFGGPLTAATQSICSVGTEPWKPAYDPVDHEV